MALVNKPDESIFASSAKQGEVDNFPDLLRGWGITFDQTQGIPPMEWFNFLFKRLDEKHAYLMQRGLPEWSATQDYTKGSCVQFDGVSYRALKNSKNNSPNESDSQYWVRWGFALSEIAHATLQQPGIVQLSSSTNSESESEAATSKAVKIAHELAESKQSPATTLAGYGIGDLKIQSFAGDINTLKIDGIYAITQAGRSQNLPVSTSCHIQVIAGGDDSWCRQLAYVAYSTDMYERHQTSYQTDSWSAWVKIDGVDKLSKTDLVGEVAFFARQSPPSGWLKANGAAVSRTTYADLFAAIGTTFGAGDGQTTFNLPDLRGEFVRGLDDGRNVDGGRRLGAVQGDAIRNITGVFDTSKGSWAQQFVDFAEASGAFDLIKGNKQWTGDPNNGGNNLPTGFKFDASRVVPTANENRPRNIALLACIKY